MSFIVESFGRVELKNGNNRTYFLLQQFLLFVTFAFHHRIKTGINDEFAIINVDLMLLIYREMISLY